ncbi:hypothetical protein CEXT_565031 [Caerostris extrusa]|uniref:Uncharacterized protein n=1 Tax=Caerostris extrusa TaxID=172846 RepID=A0AAV4RHY0_CAEEX|nr:hypothetical protein CEXT_565031 [Caerostris extrusa]
MTALPSLPVVNIVVLTCCPAPPPLAFNVCKFGERSDVNELVRNKLKDYESRLHQDPVPSINDEADVHHINRMACGTS